MESHLPNHSWIYVPISLKFNHEFIHIHHMILYTTVQVLRKHHSCFCTHKTTDRSISFLGWWFYRPCPDESLLHRRIVSLVGWNLNTSCHLLQLPWPLTKYIAQTSAYSLVWHRFPTLYVVVSCPFFCFPIQPSISLGIVQVLSTNLFCYYENYAL